MKDWILVVVAGVFIVYVVIGGVVFTVLEHEFEESTRFNTKEYKRNWLEAHPSVSEAELDVFIDDILDSYKKGIVASSERINDVTWDLPTSIYFGVTVITTIGYGNITPRTSGGRVFCVFFALLGIPFCLVLFAKIGYRMSHHIKSLDTWISLRMHCGFCHTYPRLRKLISYTCVYVLSTTLMLLIPALIIAKLEHGWSYGDGLYYTFMTLTTVGFGDCVAGFHDTWGTPVYRLLLAGWMVIGLSWMATCITSVQDLMDGMFQKLYNRQGDTNTKALDSNLEHHSLEDLLNTNTSPASSTCSCRRVFVTTVNRILFRGCHHRIIARQVNYQQKIP